MKSFLRAGLLLAAAALVLAWLFSQRGPGTPGAAHAAAPVPPGPDRYTSMEISTTVYQWWVTLWEDNSVACQVTTEFAGLPDGAEIYKYCGEQVYSVWLDTRPCTESDPTACEGYYLQFVGTATRTKEISVKLPAAEVFVSISGCTPERLTNRCDSVPRLLLSAEEPLPNESIRSIDGKFDGKPFTCPGSPCEFELDLTGEKGINIEFWASSSYGDTSEKGKALVRFVEDDITGDYYVDVISSRWRGNPLASCSESWGAFPPVGGVPEWLSTPETSEGLSSDIPYTYLAGNLISQGAVDVRGCADGGLLSTGAASPCGLDAARSVVTDWQNNFDTLIFETSHTTGVPAVLLKNIFSRESQFWPGVFRQGQGDVGLGQLTENGADTALLWNPEFYAQFCPLVLSERTCRKSYPQLSASQQATLRGALVHSVDATCETCPLGLDLSKANFSIGVFAQTLLANCEQTGKIIRNVYGVSPGEATQFEDLWKFTLVNYNAGPGCLSKSMTELKKANLPLTWDNLVGKMSPVCRLSVDYVNDISQ